MAGARIGIRRLRENLSQAIRRVRAGETLEVTHRGQPVARLVPVGRRASKLDQMVAAGVLHAPRGAGPLPAPLELPSAMTGEEAIAILRGD
jgi:prevent-host-death family protein